MEFSVFLVLFTLLALHFTIAMAIREAWLPNDDVSSLAPLNSHHFHSSIVSLESSIVERKYELPERGQSVEEIQEMIKEKLDIIASLQSAVEMLQESINGHEQMSKSDKQAGELEKQIQRLRKDIEMENKKKDSLGARASAVEERIQHLNLKLEKLCKVNDEQENQIRKTEDLLEVAEEELMKAESETSVLSEDLNRAKTISHGKWLLEWVSFHFDRVQLTLVWYWNELWRPGVDVSIQMGVEMKARVEEWIKLQIEMIKMDWIPILKDQSLTIIASLKPLLRSFTSNTVDLYNVLKHSITSHSSKVLTGILSHAQEKIPLFIAALKKYVQLLTSAIVDMSYESSSFIAPRALKTVEDLSCYARKTKNFTESYMQQTAKLSKSHIEKVYFILKPGGVQVLHALVSSHHRVQELLKNNEFVQPVANMDLAWFVATALLLAVPALFMLKLYSALTIR